MSRSIDVAGISIGAKTARCAHACRYCLMGKKSLSKVDARRFVDIVNRFIDWRTTNNQEFLIYQGINYSANMSAEDNARLLTLHDRLNWAPLTRRVHLGGLPIWDEDQIRDWLSVRKDQGILSVHASFAAFGKVHDYWNNRKGDFDYLFKVMSIAHDLGLDLRQRLFVIKSTIPLLEETMRRLDEAGEPLERYFLTFFYKGTALRHEAERITRADIDTLPPSILEHPGWNADDWRSESDWVRYYRSEGVKTERAMLRLELNDSNIDEIERQSCDEIVHRLTEQTRSAYAALPSRQELAEYWSDAANTFIYPCSADIERLWLDRYLAEHPLKFDRHLTHLSTMH